MGLEPKTPDGIHPYYFFTTAGHPRSALVLKRLEDLARDPTKGCADKGIITAVLDSSGVTQLPVELARCVVLFDQERKGHYSPYSPAQDAKEIEGLPGWCTKEFPWAVAIKNAGALEKNLGSTAGFVFATFVREFRARLNKLPWGQDIRTLAISSNSRERGRFRRGFRAPI